MSEQSMADEQNHPSTKEMTMYRIESWRDDIEPIRVAKETASFVTVVERDWRGKDVSRRQAKDGRIFRTWEDAHKELLDRAQQGVKYAEDALQRARTKLGQVKVMKP